MGYPIYMDDRAISLAWDKICLDTPRTDSSLRRITELKFTRKMIRRYFSGWCVNTPCTEKSSMGVHLLVSQATLFAKGALSPFTQIDTVIVNQVSAKSQ